MQTTHIRTFKFANLGSARNQEEVLAEKKKNNKKILDTQKVGLRSIPDDPDFLKGQVYISTLFVFDWRFL